jgi:hypothetical protein
MFSLASGSAGEPDQFDTGGVLAVGSRRTLPVRSDCKRQLSKRHIPVDSGTDLMSQ